MNKKEYFQRMESVRGLALNGRLSEALTEVDEIIQLSPTRPDPFLLKGNMLAMMDNSGQEAVTTNQERAACISKALELDEKCVPAIIDMADYLAEVATRKSEALAYYDRAIALLEEGKSWNSQEDELEEAARGRSELLTSLKGGDN